MDRGPALPPEPEATDGPRPPVVGDEGQPVRPVVVKQVPEVLRAEVDRDRRVEQRLGEARVPEPAGGREEQLHEPEARPVLLRVLGEGVRVPAALHVDHRHDQRRRYPMALRGGADQTAELVD